MKVANFYSEFLQNITQYALIVACFQKFHREFFKTQFDKKIYTKTH